MRERIRLSLARWLPGLGIAIPVLLIFNVHLLELGARLLGSADETGFSLWHLWWPAFSAQRADAAVIHTYTSPPFLSNHLLYTPLPTSILFSALQPLVGPLWAFNLLLIASSAATAVALYYWLHRNAVPALAALLGVAAFMLSPWYISAISRSDIITAGLWPLPLAFILWDAWCESPTPGRLVLLGAVLYGAVLNGVQHLSWIMGLWLPYAVWTWRRGQSDPDHPLHQRRLAAQSQLSAMALVFAMLLLIYPLNTVARTLQGNEPAFSVSPLLLPPEQRSILGMIRRTSPAVLALAAAAIATGVRLRRSEVWLVLGLINLMAALGLINPLRMLSASLPKSGLTLYSIDVLWGSVMFGLATYSAVALGDIWLAHRTRFIRLWSPLLAGVMIAAFGLLAIRQQTSTLIPYQSLYAQMRAEPEDYTVLHYPFGLVSQVDGRTLGQAAYLFRDAVWHGKRTMSGIAPYYPDDVFAALGSVTYLHPESLKSSRDLQRAADELADAVRRVRIGYILIFSEEMDSQQLATLQSLIDASGALCPASQAGTLFAYRALWHPSGCDS